MPVVRHRSGLWRAAVHGRSRRVGPDRVHHRGLLGESHFRPKSGTIASASLEGRTVTLSPDALELQQATWGARLASGFLALVGGTTRIRTVKKEIEKKTAEARTRWHNLQNNWNSYTSAKDFDDLYLQLQNLRSQHDALRGSKRYIIWK